MRVDLYRRVIFVFTTIITIITTNMIILFFLPVIHKYKLFINLVRIECITDMIRLLDSAETC